MISISLLLALLSTGLNGQRSVQNVTIDPVNPQSQLIIRSGDYHNLTCKIAVVESTAESTPTTINFFQMGYSYAIMQPMNVTNSYTCAVTGSTQVCERVAVIDESLRNQVVQCAFIVDGIFFYSRSVFVKVEDEETPVIEPEDCDCSQPPPTVIEPEDCDCSQPPPTVIETEDCDCSQPPPTDCTENDQYHHTKNSTEESSGGALIGLAVPSMACVSLMITALISFHLV